VITVDRKLAERKPDVMAYFRERAAETMSETRRRFGESQFKDRASHINKASTEAYRQVVEGVRAKSAAESWDSEEQLSALLMLNYANAVVMVETRNEVWPYDYMTFSRRIGELWQPFCKLCFEYPVSTVQPVIPPLFKDVKLALANEVEAYISELPISAAQHIELKAYYDKVWALVNSGEINLALDLHFQFDSTQFAVDFKSAFGSNEKGNTNRLLLVASIYRAFDKDSRCLLWVRAEEDQNNAYFRTLQRSGIWEAFCGDETYDQISHYSGFNLREWMRSNVDWLTDLDTSTAKHIVDSGLGRYVEW